MTTHPGPTNLSLDGDAVRPGDPDYDATRQVYNAMHDGRPEIIVRCASEGDVVAALAYARESGLEVCVRSGGHSAPGFSNVEGALVIDVRRLKDVTVDAEAGTVRAGAGLTWGELDAATQESGLAVTGGRVSHTGVSGLALGSGSGWLERAMGLTSDNLLAARVVTAAGEIVTASETENPDLYWALRGGGGNFGVVTEFTLRLMRVGPIVRGGMRIYPFPRAAEVMRAYAEVMRDAPDALCGGLALLSAPPAPFVPPEAVGKPIVSVIVLWTGPPEEADAAVALLDALGEPIVDLVQDMPYTAVQQLLDEGNPYGVMREYQGSGFLTELDDASIDLLVAAAAEPATTETVLILQPMGGAYGRVPDDATALGQRDATWAYQLLTQWTDPAEDARCRAWTKELNAGLQRQAEAPSFPNFVSDTEAVVLRSAYEPATLERLQAAKRAWDPDNVFCHNHRLLD
ncbi:FAD-binding oxidoreductase [Paraconexibacter sp.]|uniref:FAD-binding oxidoreductase n=1 Tax=Paraconexibacter sp. TaxID=2949640 RepID=UPI003566C8FA